jgi:hypothetical protein
MLYLLLLPLAASATDPLLQASRCGLVNNVNRTQVSAFASEKNNYDDAVFDDFIQERSLVDLESIYDLDYCRFQLEDQPQMQIDVLCDKDLNCVCTVYFGGTKCSSCSLCLDDSVEELPFPFPISLVSADCSAVNSGYPECSVSCDSSDANKLPDIEGCFLLPSPAPAGSPSGTTAPTTGPTTGRINNQGNGAISGATAVSTTGVMYGIPIIMMFAAAMSM